MAEERDLIKLRTNYRKERVYLYRLRATREQSKTFLLSYLTEMNRLVDEPEFYNAISRNCTTTVHLHCNATDPEAPAPMDWRLVLSGHVDELLYERGAISQAMPFAELRDSRRVDLEMQKYDEDSYSSMLRQVAK